MTLNSVMSQIVSECAAHLFRFEGPHAIESSYGQNVLVITVATLPIIVARWRGFF